MEAKEDPNAPKGKKSAYIFFSAAKSKEIKEENPSISQSEVMSMCGAKWKALSDDDKAPFQVAKVCTPL